MIGMVRTDKGGAPWMSLLGFWVPLSLFVIFYVSAIAGDSILPMLGLTHDELHFQCFSKDYGMEKPDGRFFIAAKNQAETYLTLYSPDGSSMKQLDPLLPSQVLHVGNDFTKDFEGALRAGMHAVLLDRYNETELAEEWKRRGAVVLKDLLDVVEFLGRTNCDLGHRFSIQ